MNETIIALLQDIAFTNRALQARLAPANMTTREQVYSGSDTSSSPPKVLNIGGTVGDIDCNLTQGRVYVFFDFHGSTTGTPTFVLDAAVPGPRHFPPRRVGTAAFVVAPGSVPPKGSISLYHY